MNDLETEIARRRTFAIIAHPDAGKTTLTEKLLLFGGAIQLAGEVKAKGDRRRARSDWLKVEQERGISVVTSVMSFHYNNCAFNLLDTPGHEDFSEDTYRTLSAVDSAVMVIDAAKGIESQTRKLFEVCRLRDIPIITFINKMDREGRDVFELLDEIEKTLALDVTPANWPIGMGREFKGCYDLLQDQLILVSKEGAAKPSENVVCRDLNDPALETHVGDHLAAELRENAEMARGACKPFSEQAYREGHLTPVFFGSALRTFGVKELLDGLARYAPPPRAQPTTTRNIEPAEKKVSGFVFKIQANMDPKHRDRIAFLRLASGHFEKGMKLHHTRSNKQIAVHNPLMFFAQDRETVMDAYAGDIIGIPNYGTLRIGDTLTEGENLQVTGIPSFAPEQLQRIRPLDPLRAKHLGAALVQLAEEGAARVFKPQMDTDWIVGVMGALQFDVLADRIRTEFQVPVKFEPAPYVTARWLQADTHAAIKNFMDKNPADIAVDHDDEPVFMARNLWRLDKAVEEYKDIRFMATRV